jgi:hypothetical protein
MNSVSKICTWVALAISLFSASVILGQQAPKTMIKISTRVIEPAPKRGSFPAEPRTVWRGGTKYARIAESPDPGNHIHGLVIVSEPDVWMVNLFDKSGKHIIDPGPVLDVHLPVFEPVEGAKTKLDELELGRELEFFTKNGAKESAGEVEGKPSTRHEITINGDKVVLWTDTKSGKPLRVSLVKGSETQTIAYLAYEDELPFDAALFQPPSGITIRYRRGCGLSHPSCSWL